MITHWWEWALLIGILLASAGVMAFWAYWMFKI